MIWTTVSSRSCFCWLYRASPSLASKNIINWILVLAVWWCPCVESSRVVGRRCLLWPVHSLDKTLLANIQFSSVQLLSQVRLFATPWTSARQASLSITNSWSLPKLMTIELVMPSNRLILCRPLLLQSSIFPSIRSFQIIQLFASGGQSIGVSAMPILCLLKTKTKTKNYKYSVQVNLKVYG